MKGKIVVENTLTPYIEYLKDYGYDVFTLYKNSNIEYITSDEYKAIVISGMDALSTSGPTYNNPPAPIIEAEGRTPEEVKDIIEDRSQWL